MTARLPVTQLAIRRAIAAVQRAGLPVSGVTVAPNGSVTVHSGEKSPQGLPDASAEPSKWEDAEA